MFDKGVKTIALNYIYKHGRTRKAIVQYHLDSGIALSTLYKWIDQHKRIGFVTVNNKRNSCRRAYLKQFHLDWLINELSQNPTAYQVEMRDMVFEMFGYVYSQSAISRYLKRRNITRKSLQVHAKLQSHEQRAEFRHILRGERKGGIFGARHLVFCDEVACNTKQARRKFGYSARGQPAFILENSLHGEESVSCISSVCIDGHLS
jgi:transposase